jgi:CheY-like chemotaxis protein
MKIVGRVLEDEGYTIRIAENGVRGLEQFFLTLPDLIVLDVKMHEIDGWEMLERLREI